MTIGQFGRRFGLSRGTLLYYDARGLLSPSARSPAGYRLYSESDARRMERIGLYRRAGLRLADIARVLEGGAGEPERSLETRLRDLDREIDRLREQQRWVLALLRRPDALRGAGRLDRRGWVAILRATGLDEAAMRRWHVEFERHSPDAHGEFLRSLGIPADEIERIRAWAADP